MANNYYPTADALYLQWVTNFATVAAANATALGLTTGETTAMTGMATAFDTAYTASQAAKLNSKTKVAAKDSTRGVSDDLFRGYAKMIMGDPGVSVELKTQLGLHPIPNPAATLVPPVNLVVNGYATGVNALAWERNGNSKSVTYLIEASEDNEANWMMIGASTSLKFEHTGQIPGQKIAYRVAAQRGKNQSVPCQAASAYDSIPTQTLFLKKAA